MYELILGLLFVIPIIMNKMKIMSALNFIVGVIIYFLYELTILDELTMKLSFMLLLIISGMYFMVTTMNEETQS
jgi:hypothetical protein